MTVLEKYAKYRDSSDSGTSIQNGDIILVRGTSIIARMIELGDAKDGHNAYFNHALVVLRDQDRLLALESEAHGVRPDFLSEVIGKDCADFAILRPLFPQELIDTCINKAFQEGENGIPYNYEMLIQILIKRKLGQDTKLGDDQKKNICSVFAGRTYGGLLPLTCYSEEKTGQDFITPQDLLRFLDPSEIKRIDTEVLDT